MLAANIFSEPLLLQQWNFLNTGQQVGNPDFQEIFAVAGEDINVGPVWLQGLTGAGVVIAVVDSGVETDHPDLVANIHPTLEFDFLDDDNNADPDTSDPANTRGTAVAGIIAAAANGSGTVGVAPDAQLVPVRLFDASGAATDQDFVDMLQLWQSGIDIFNHSWETDDNFREITQLTVAQEQALRDSIFFGRNGLGAIHVKSAGNDAGPRQSAGFGDLGNWDSAQYDGFANSRFVIAVAGVDHDGGYNNIDGTVTTHFEAGANVLVAAPSGSLRATNILDDNGIGSGIYTTDLTGDNGFNRAPINGIEIDRDFLADTAYTSRYNGAEVAAAQVSGVVALMLQANPNLSWRDVQAILVRSARQVSPFEVPATGFPFGFRAPTWAVNRNETFREPDSVGNGVFGAPIGGSVYNPIMDPNSGFIRFSPFESNPNAVTTFEHFAGTPDVFTNGAGFTVSQARGASGETVGFGHGVVDAELAVELAKQWTIKDQHLPDELTYTTSIVPIAGTVILAAEIGSDESGNLLVPGKVGATGNAGFISYYNIFFEDEPDFSDYDDSRSSGTYLPLQIPDSNAMTVEWAEVKLDINGNADDLDRLRVSLISPDGTASELNHHFDDRLNVSFQDGVSHSGFITNPPGTIDPPGANLTFSFSTNRHWGERYDSNPQIDPATGNPFPANFAVDFTQGWELHLENFSDSAFTFGAFEVAWHGSAIDPDSQRVQGLVGVDENQDAIFNFERWVQTNTDRNGDGVINRLGEITRAVDITQESFAANTTVTVRRTGETTIVDQFVTGADGNFYFDLVPDFYTISVEDAAGRTALDDPNAPSGFLQKYKTEWNITPDYFDAINHARVSPALSGGFDPRVDYDIPIDAFGNPSPFINPGTGGAMEADVKIVNFLLDPGPAAAQATVLTGIIFADLDGNGLFDNNDVLQTGVEVYADLNGNGVHDPATEALAKSIEDGTYTLSVPTSISQLVPLRVLPPAGWTVTTPDDGFYTVFGGPGRTASDLDFGLQPPQVQREFSVGGFVFSDLDSSGSLNGLEQGQGGVQVYADLNDNGVFDTDNEPNSTTVADGSFNFVVPTFDPLSINVSTVVPDPNDGRTFTNPASNSISSTASPGDVITGLEFGINFPLPPPGSIFGRVFEDRNGDGSQDGDDFGASGFQVFLDLDQNGVFNSGDETTTSDANGNYFFAGVTPGNIHVRIVTAPEFQVTTFGGSLAVTTVVSGQAAGSVIFGVHNLDEITDPITGLPIQLLDFGDLEGYPTLLSENGARHIVVDGFSLGVRLDRESDGQPNMQGNGDDTNGISDEDGIRVVSSIGSPVDIFGQPIKIHAGTNFIEVTVLGIGGNLSGWMDFDGNGDWLGEDEKVFDSIDLLPGRYVLPVFAPMIPDNGGIAARFRWGEANLDFFGGSLFAGEVEDYVLPTSNGTTLISGDAVPGDFDGSGLVDQGDYDLWKSTFGSTSDLRADGNLNGQIDVSDYTVWQDNLGATVSASASSLAFATFSTGSATSETVAERQYPISIAATRPDFVPLPASETAEESQGIATASVQVVAATSSDLLFSLAAPSPTATAQPVESTSDQTPSDNSLLALALAEYGTAEEDEEVESLLASDTADTDSESELAMAVDAALETVLL